jgi:hypothetical protein
VVGDIRERGDLSFSLLILRRSHNNQRPRQLRTNRRDLRNDGKGRTLLANAMVLHSTGGKEEKKKLNKRRDMGACGERSSMTAAAPFEGVQSTAMTFLRVGLGKQYTTPKAQRGGDRRECLVVATPNTVGPYWATSQHISAHSAECHLTENLRLGNDPRNV